MLKYPQHYITSHITYIQKVKVTIKLRISVYCMVQQELGRWTSKPRFIDGLHGGSQHSMHLSTEHFGFVQWESTLCTSRWILRTSPLDRCLGQRSPATCSRRISVHFGRRSCQEQVVLGSQHCQLNFQLHGLCSRSQLNDGSPVLGSLWYFTAAFFLCHKPRREAWTSPKCFSSHCFFNVFFPCSVICYARTWGQKQLETLEKRSAVLWACQCGEKSLTASSFTAFRNPDESVWVNGIKFHSGRKNKIEKSEYWSPRKSHHSTTINSQYNLILIFPKQ